MKMEDRKGYEDMEFNFQGKTSVTESNQTKHNKIWVEWNKGTPNRKHKNLSILRIW